MKQKKITPPDGMIIKSVDFNDAELVIEFDEIDTNMVIPDVSCIDDDIQKRIDALAIMWQVQRLMGEPDPYADCYKIISSRRSGIFYSVHTSADLLPCFKSKAIAEAVLLKYNDVLKTLFND